MNRPTTDSELFTYVHRLFGVGDWDGDGPMPFWKWRAREVMKVTAKRRKLKVTVEELADAADFCKATGEDIRNVAWLYKHLGDARRWAAARERALSERDFDEVFDSAVAYEAEQDGSEWFGRLVRSRGEHRREVYEAWRTWRKSSRSVVKQDHARGPASSAGTPS